MLLKININILSFIKKIYKNYIQAKFIHHFIYYYRYNE
ncbi:hypothetical protein J714_1576 [Acinetobacter baumannii 756476]|nr:hypothetical protein J714_1576 [Acinetobacter baumannii 756476]